MESTDGDHRKKRFKVIEKHVAEGTIIWTDGHASYNFLDEYPYFFHETVIHRRGEMVRLNALGQKVSTNAIEGLFSRVKRMLRIYQANRATLPLNNLFLPFFFPILNF